MVFNYRFFSTGLTVNGSFAQYWLPYRCLTTIIVNNILWAITKQVCQFANLLCINCWNRLGILARSTVVKEYTWNCNCWCIFRISITIVELNNKIWFRYGRISHHGWIIYQFTINRLLLILYKCITVLLIDFVLFG